ncbi:MAG: TIR domain-containing protein [Leptolyngbya sp. SIO1D8]|nr:TIR domain-containing protein [Leptolyngbya sp. SIO1D8]
MFDSLTPRERLALIDLVNALLLEDFERLVYAINAPDYLIPSNFSAQGNRAAALLKWVEGPTGCDLTDFLTLLAQVAPSAFQETWSHDRFKGINPSQSTRDVSPEPLPVTTSQKRIFISYKREVSPDEEIALELYNTLGQTHSVFIDQTMLVGTPWAARIKTEIQQSDALIVLLSEQAVNSEMVQVELSLAHEMARRNGGRPVILPVRLAYREPFQYPLSAYLDPINWAFWEGPADTPVLIDELQQALSGEALSIQTPQDKANILQVKVPGAMPRPSPSAQPQAAKHGQAAVPLELPEGTMMPDSQFYVSRPFDQVAIQTIQQQGVTITIKGPRQMGKSSLLTRVMAAAATDKQVAFLDFQLFDKAALTDADTFFPEFCAWLTDELELEDQVDEYWKRRLSNTQRCTRYVGKYLLPTLAQPLVLAMDEVETIFDTAFRSDFFGMLRSWHNNRATKPIWKQLDLALVTSTEPYQLIDNLNQSPFNVGQIIELTDFDLAQVTDLNRRHGQILSSDDLQQLMDLVNGHPYLVRKALYLIASETLSARDLLTQAQKERGPFGDHLRYHLFRMYDKPELVQGFLQVIRTHTCADERIFFRLRGAGLVRRRSSGLEVVPRCQLYEQYFQQHLS